MDYHHAKEGEYDIHCIDSEGFFSDKVRIAIKARLLSKEGMTAKKANDEADTINKLGNARSVKFM
jgi:hypothetical protein